MVATHDLSTREIGSTQLKLVDELIVAPQTHGQKTYYHIEHPSKGKFYRVGYAEYVFLSLLDGTRTVAQALTITARTLGSKALTQARGVEVANWLLEHGLAHFADSQSAWAPPNGCPGGQSGNLFKRINPFWMKLSLGSPDRILAAILPALGWLLSPWATIAGFLLIVVGAGCIASHWAPFTASAATVLSPHNWLWMFVAWACLKVIHELAHGLACKYYRGDVRDTGLIFILLAPMAYVDVTSCWRFPSRWQRIHVAAAGMFAELAVAALAAIAWVYVDSSILHHLLFNIIMMASLSTLLFNANPLMRFDGYYILADLLQIPNLATDGRRAVKNMTARVFFGERNQPLQILGIRRWLVCGYGLAATAWRLLICVSLITAASVLFHGAGLILAAIGVVSWFGMPIWKLIVDLQRRLHERRPTFIRVSVVGITLVLAFTASLLWVPWPGLMKAPVVVDYSDLSVVRSSASGFIRRVHVVDGQLVKAGDLLVELENDELMAQQNELEITLRQGNVQHRVALGQQQGADAQIELRNLQATEERLSEIRRQSVGLQVRAPVDGRIVARNLKQTLGTYVKEGTEILTVANESRKELILSVGQEEIDAIMPYVSGQTRFRIGSRFAREGRLDRLEPRASTVLPHPAMSSAVGGSLSVTQQQDNGQTELRLVEPRFRGVITLSPEVCKDLGAGEQGYAMLGLRQESIGEFAWVRFHRWFELLLRPAN